MRIKLYRPSAFGHINNNTYFTCKTITSLMYNIEKLIAHNIPFMYNNDNDKIVISDLNITIQDTEDGTFIVDLPL